jgi:hypothetical protein
MGKNDINQEDVAESAQDINEQKKPLWQTIKESTKNFSRKTGILLWLAASSIAFDQANAQSTPGALRGTPEHQQIKTALERFMKRLPNNATLLSNFEMLNDDLTPEEEEKMRADMTKAKQSPIYFGDANDVLNALDEKGVAKITETKEERDARIALEDQVKLQETLLAALNKSFFDTELWSNEPSKWGNCEIRGRKGNLITKFSPIPGSKNASPKSTALQRIKVFEWHIKINVVFTGWPTDTLRIKLRDSAGKLGDSIVLNNGINFITIPAGSSSDANLEIVNMPDTPETVITWFSASRATSEEVFLAGNKETDKNAE